MSIMNQIKQFNIKNIATDTIKNVADYYCKSPENKANLLTWTYLATTITSSACQIWSIKQNKNIPEEKKSFLIPQEFLDAVINAVMFVTFAKSFGDMGKALVDKGKILSPEIKNMLEPEIKKMLEKVDLKSVEKVTESLGKLKGDNLVIFNQYKSGIGVLFSVTGSILATCIAAPFLRNKFASVFQKKINKLENPTQEVKPQFDTGKTFQNNPVKPQTKIVKPNTQMSDFLYTTKNQLYKV